MPMRAWPGALGPSVVILGFPLSEAAESTSRTGPVQWRAAGRFGPQRAMLWSPSQPKVCGLPQEIPQWDRARQLTSPAERALVTWAGPLHASAQGTQ